MSDLFKPKHCVGVSGPVLGRSRRTLAHIVERTESDIDMLTRVTFLGWPEGLAPSNTDAPILPAIIALRKAKDDLQKALDYLRDCVGDSPPL